MKTIRPHIVSLLLQFVLAIILLASCGGYARNYQEAPIQEGTYRARALLSKENLRKYDKLYLEAICQELNNHSDAAFDLLQHALAINPNASEALYEMALLQLRLNPKSDSLLVAEGDAMLQKSVQLEPSNRHYRRTLAERWIRTGKYARAAKLYEDLTTEKPNPQDITILIKLYETLGDFPHALKATERLENINGANEQIALEKFRIYQEMGKLAEAYGVIEKISEEHPDDLKFRVLLGDLYMQNGYKEKALGIYNDILATEPGNRLVKMAMLPYIIEEGDTSTFETNMSEIMLDATIENEQKASILQAYATEFLRDGKGAGKESVYNHFLEALTIPQYNNALSEMCIAFVNAAQMPQDSLRKPLLAILRDEPENTQARLQMLSMLINDENYTDIASLCHEGTECDPENLLFYYYEGIALQQLDNISKATNAFERGLAHIKDDSDMDIASNIYAFLGDNYHSMGRNEDAFNAYEHSLQHNDSNILCLNNYAYFLCLEAKTNLNCKDRRLKQIATTQLDKAHSMSKKVVDSHPDEPTYLDTYAWILYCKQHHTQAQIYINQMLSKIPEEARANANSATLYDHAGDIYLSCGDIKTAVMYWQHAAQITDDQTLKKKIDNKIKNKKL